ncbi:MAG: AAA family ATPase [Solobacterium sp.]|nr:AAA family ATPase [Solobacterium sp.]
MHIQQAKTQIKNAIIAYGTKDSRGRYKIPVSKQRPVFLVGAPGIGKTAIVEQIAREMNIGFVSYSMTHHTRQSALGLPFIIQKEFGGNKYSVSEYTMSEILATVYEEMEKTGKKEGILFLDEINCVSETLAPSMLQFLQYKTFGRHHVPEGWIVVTAGNPPEYNDSVREFDIAMLDRLKKIEVEPDYEVWKEFAIQTGVHPSVLSYLAIKPNFFYRVTTTVDGVSFVTARAWDDLSQMISLYEENQIRVDYDLICQYIQDEQIAKDFNNYYDLYHKYRSDYQVETILDGTASGDILARAKEAQFDERLSLTSLILSSLEDTVSKTVLEEDALKTVIHDIKEITTPYTRFLRNQIEAYRRKTLSTDTKEHIELAYAVQDLYEEIYNKVQVSGDSFEKVKAVIQNHLKELKKMDSRCQSSLNNVFTFYEDAFGQGQEMLVLVSELTIRPDISRYIFSHGCDKYYQYNQQLLFENRQNSLQDRIDALNLLEF